MIKTEFYSDKPVDYIHMALAVETLAYHNKNYLSKNLQDNSRISEEVQALLIKAIELMNK